MIRLIQRIFRPRIVVQTYRTRKADSRELVRQKTRELAREMGRPDPFHGMVE